jgi:hypothetical protein
MRLKVWRGGHYSHFELLAAGRKLGDLAPQMGRLDTAPVKTP